MKWAAPPILETITLTLVAAALYITNLTWPFVGAVAGTFVALLSLACLGWGLRRLHTDLGGDERSPICWYCGRAFPDMADFAFHAEECDKERKRRQEGVVHDQRDPEEDEH